MPPVWFTRADSCRAVALIHGFSGSADTWEAVASVLAAAGHAVVGVPLPGHDGPELRQADTFDAAVDCLGETLRQLRVARLQAVGYSLGARLLLGLLVRQPRSVERAVLIGGHPGLQTLEERQARAQADAKWEALLRAGDMAAFADAWQQQPVFASQTRLPAQLLAQQRAQRLQHDPQRLAAIFHATSLARMPNYWPRLPDLNAPVHFVAGEHDAKFRELLTHAQAATPGSTLDLILKSGHNPVLEQPAILAECLLGLLTSREADSPR